MSANDLLFKLYQKFYEQRSVLTGAPALTMDISKTPDKFDAALADKEIAPVISYLLGTQDVLKLQWNEALQLIKKYYTNQPEWQRLLLDYFAYLLEKEKEDIAHQQADFLSQVLKQFETNTGKTIQSEISENRPSDATV